MAELIPAPLVIAARVASHRGHAETAPLRIGVNLKRTGPISSYGQHALVSAQIAAGKQKSERGLPGQLTHR